MTGNAAFAVPRDRLEVTLRLDQGVILEGEIFLEYMAGDLAVHHLITAFLENDTLFFPIMINTSGGTEFISKKSVRIVEVDIPEASEVDYFFHLLMRAIPVTAHFSDGTSLSGDLMAEVPQEKARLSDCLNMRNNFLCVKTAGKMCYLNKEALQKVVHGDR